MIKNVSRCGIDAKSFEEILGFSCSSYMITEDGATTVAKKVAKNEIDLSTFKTVYKRTCDFDKALEISSGKLNQSINASAFEEILGFSCGSYMITEDGATTVAKKVAKNEIDLSTFETVYKRTCDFDKALEISCSKL